MSGTGHSWLRRWTGLTWSCGRGRPARSLPAATANPSGLYSISRPPFWRSHTKPHRLFRTQPKANRSLEKLLQPEKAIFKRISGSLGGGSAPHKKALTQGPPIVHHKKFTQGVMYPLEGNYILTLAM